MTTLDNPGNHASVFRLDGKTSPKLVILNGCLAYTKFLMTSHDKTFIRDIITAKFNLEVLKNAYKVLYEFANPEAKCTYQGPRKNAGTREKCIDAFDKFYALLCEYDRNGNTPVIAYPNEELSLFMSGLAERNVYDKRFAEMEASILELKHTFHTFTGVLTARQNDVFVSNSKVPGEVRGPITTIQSEARVRADSSCSLKRQRSDDEYNTANESEADAVFEYPTHYRKKMARRENHQVSKSNSFAGVLKDAVGNNSSVSNGNIAAKAAYKRKELVWGKKKSNPEASFRGVPRKPWVPQIFIYRCCAATEEVHVKEHLSAQNLGITNVKLASHTDAKYRSFIVTVESRKDFDEIISGVHVPENVLVRRYFPPRPESSQSNMSSWQQRKMAELDAIAGKSSESTEGTGQSSSSQLVETSATVNVTLPATDELMTLSQMTDSNKA